MVRDASVNTVTRILFHINDFGRGGTETALMSWLRTLDRTRFQIGLSIAYPTADFERIYCARLPEDIKVHFLADQPWKHAMNTRKREGRETALSRFVTRCAVRPLLGVLFRRTLREIAADYDVICDFDLTLGKHAGAFGKPWIGVNHFSFAARLAGKAKRVRRATRRYNRYACLAALNEQMAAEALDIFGDKLPQLSLLPNVVELETVRKLAGTSVEVRVANYIVSVARLDEGQKDHSTLLRAYALLISQRSVEEDLVFVGDGVDRGRLEALAQELGIASRVHFLGFHANPFPYMRHARAFVLSSRFEGLPMVLIEAMALGTPVIATDCPTGPRTLLGGIEGDGREQAGLLVPVGDHAALAQAIERVLTDESVRTRLVDAAQRTAEAYGPESASQRMGALVTRARTRGPLVGGRSAAALSAT